MSTKILIPTSKELSGEYVFVFIQGDWHRTKDILLNGPDWIIN